MTICRFFRTPGGCFRGTDCWFRHDLTSSPQQEAIPRTDPTSRSEGADVGNDVTDLTNGIANVTMGPKIQELGGARVVFADGAAIASIEPARGESAQLHMSKISCRWYAPSRFAALLFNHTHTMTGARNILSKAKIHNRQLDLRIHVDRRSTPMVCSIKVGNLDVLTTEAAITEACGTYKPYQVSLGKPSYDATEEAVSREIRGFLSWHGAVKTWKLHHGEYDPMYKATITMDTAEAAKAAVGHLDGHRLPQLGHSKIFLDHRILVKYIVLTQAYKMVSPELERLRKQRPSGGYVDIRVFSSSSHVTSVHIVSNSLEEVARTKSTVSAILNGHLVKSRSGPIWHKTFQKPEGTVFLNNLGHKLGVFIYKNTRKRELRLYGPKTRLVSNRKAVLNSVRSLSQAFLLCSTNETPSQSGFLEAYRTIIQRLGRSSVSLVVKDGSRKIRIEGSIRDANWARDTLNSIPQDSAPSSDRVESRPSCSVCRCLIDDDEEAYRTNCGHLYDRTCFALQCANIGVRGPPLRCEGDEGVCQSIIPFSDLEAALNPNELGDLLSSAFNDHVRKHPIQYGYCPTADCNQVFAKSSPESKTKIFVCPICVSEICTLCGASSHDGLSCEENKERRTDEVFEQWKEEHQTRTCNCGATIEKREGCNHMLCISCGGHMCWKCGEMFPTRTATYNHLTEEQDGIFDAEFVEQQQHGQFEGPHQPDLPALFGDPGVFEQIDRAEFEEPLGFNIWIPPPWQNALANQGD